MRWWRALSLGGMCGMVACNTGRSSVVDDDSLSGGTSTSGSDSETSTTSGTTGASTGTPDTAGSSSTGASADCPCAPGTDLIHVVSDDSELWTYDPRTNEFARVGQLGCAGFDPFSMAIDRTGRAWILLLDNIPHAAVAKGLFTVDIRDASGCEPVVYTEGIFGVFGMSFVSNPPPDTCEELHVQSYSGAGPFAEGEGLGFLGVMTDEMALASFGTIDFDGGELAGTGDGRLFAFTGVQPAKLVEFSRDDASVISSTPLGVSKTNASAMAFFGGDLYLFTESGPPGCQECLDGACPDEVTACDADPDCAPVRECLLASGAEGASGCEGDIAGPGGPLRDCMIGPCIDACNTGSDGVVSKVIHHDLDGSDGTAGANQTLTEFAPIRIVGAASSTCAPVNVP